MTTSDERVPLTHLEPIKREQAHIGTLQTNVLTWYAVLFACAACVAPMAALFFNVPGMASQAGASTPLVFLIGAIGLLLLIQPITYFARRLTSTAGFSTWIGHGLGHRMGLFAGWLIFGAYALFEAASQAAFGGLTESNLSTFFGLHMPGGWLVYTLASVLLVWILAYFDVKWSVWIMAPFAILEMASLLLFDLAITMHGGATGNDLIHTFTTAGTSLKGVVPGGWLGVGVAMALAFFSYIGFESAGGYGEETNHPHRAIPFSMIAIAVLMSILYIWTAYSATIGLGWTHAVDTLGNVSLAPTPYYQLADHYVGSWLKILMSVLVTTSTFASCIAFHQVAARYLYAMGREQVFPAVLGLCKTHARWKSPWVASTLQTGITLLLMIFLSFVIQKSNPDGTVQYALGITHDAYTSTGGIGTYQWLAIVGTMLLLTVYLLTNIAAPVSAWRYHEFNVLTHVVAPVLSSLIVLIPLTALIVPPLPVIGTAFTNIGFLPTPFPLNILPLFFLGWAGTGLLYGVYLARFRPERYKDVKQMEREEE
jgi:amino acid transporter